MPPVPIVRSRPFAIVRRRSFVDRSARSFGSIAPAAAEPCKPPKGQTLRGFESHFLRDAVNPERLAHEHLELSAFFRKAQVGAHHQALRRGAQAHAVGELHVLVQFARVELGRHVAYFNKAHQLGEVHAESIQEAEALQQAATGGVALLGGVVDPAAVVQAGGGEAALVEQAADGRAQEDRRAVEKLLAVDHVKIIPGRHVREPRVERDASCLRARAGTQRAGL